MQGCFEVEVVEAKAILEGLKLSRRIFDPLLVEFDALNVINLCVGRLISRCEVDNGRLDKLVFKYSLYLKSTETFDFNNINFSWENQQYLYNNRKQAISAESSSRSVVAVTGHDAHC
ncbi:hypothetical protein ACOSP7_012308 [Xanthoceras sorbifolium]